MPGRKRAKKCARRCNTDDDRISELPDDIMVHIISFLTLKEAVGTSVLSSRWLNLWKHTPSLVFDAHISFKNVARGSDICSVKRRKYVKWVNCIIRSHKAVALKDLRICLNLSISARKEVTRWLNFAFERHVQMLELNFSPKSEDFINLSRFYYCSFPEEFFTQYSIGDVDFKSLKVLSLKCVEVTCEAVKLILHNFLLLEKLVVNDTYKLLNLEVSGPSLVLKRLVLICCRDLKSVKVSAPNLTSLVLHEVPLQELLLENVPKLVDVYADFWRDITLEKEILSVFSCCVFQLEILTLQLTHNQEEIVSSVFRELPKLKKLVIKGWGNISVMGLTAWIRASPHLQEFVLKLPVRTVSRLDRQVSTIMFPHEHLKVFMFIGYDGQPGEIELVRYIVENCIVLQKVIIGPRYLQNKLFVKQGLEAQVPQHIELVIL